MSKKFSTISITCVIFNILSFCGLNAQHTFSICAVDTITGEVGSAGASCIENSIIISDVHPGVGVVHTQSFYQPVNQNYASDLMDMGLSPSAIIDSLIANDFTHNPSLRQYGVVELIDSNRTAAYTGENCYDWKGDIAGINYSIQGNILLGPEILDGMEEGFLNTTGNLACKLMAALQGAKVPGADTRCDTFNISALSSFLRVAQPADDAADLWLDLEVPDVTGDSIDPIDSLQTLFDAIGGCNYTGIKNSEIQNEIQIFPQPAENEIEFSLTEPITELYIYNMYGQLIEKLNIENKTSFRVEINSLLPGCYIYYMNSSSHNKYTGKFIKI